MCMSEPCTGWRNARAARISPDDVRIRQAAPRSPGSLSPPGLLRPRPGQAAGLLLAGSGTDADRLLRMRPGPRGVPARRGTHPARHVRHRPVPVSPHGPRKRACRTDLRPRWLALHARPEERPPASGTPMASASFRYPPHVPARPERPSSRLVRHVRGAIRQRERHQHRTGCGGGDEIGDGFLAIALRHRHAGPRSGIQQASVGAPVNPCDVTSIDPNLSGARRSGRCWIPDQVRDDGGEGSVIIQASSSPD